LGELQIHGTEQAVRHQVQRKAIAGLVEEQQSSRYVLSKLLIHDLAKRFPSRP
jgi:hypothetical protein